MRRHRSFQANPWTAATSIESADFDRLPSCSWPPLSLAMPSDQVQTVAPTTAAHDGFIEIVQTSPLACGIFGRHI
jgi:hypothetical protein